MTENKTKAGFFFILLSAARGLPRSAQAFLVPVRGADYPVVVQRPLTVVASLVVEHGL